MAEEENKEAAEAASDADDGGGKNKKKLLIIIIAAVVVLLGAGGGIFFFMAGGGEGEETSETPTEEVEETEETEATVSEEAGKEGEAKEGEAAKEGEQGGDKAKEKAVASIDFGCTYPLKVFNLNLGNHLENHYIRLEMAIEYGCSDQIKVELDKRLPQIRDAVITVASRSSREILLSPDGKFELRKEVKNRINHYMKNKIDDIFITDLLIE